MNKILIIMPNVPIAVTMLFSVRKVIAAVFCCVK